jgi:hypothetical protein
VSNTDLRLLQIIVAEASGFHHPARYCAIGTIQ